jgi:hypothetical protein
MNKLLDVNRVGGYPFVGQNTKIITEDYAAYLTAGIEALIPSYLEVLFMNELSIEQTGYVLNGTLIYNGNAQRQFMMLTGMVTPILFSDLVSNPGHYQLVVNETNYDVINSQGTFTNAYRIETATIKPVGNGGIYTYRRFSDFLKTKVMGERLFLNMNNRPVTTHVGLTFNASGNITSPATPIPPGNITWVGTNNYIEKIGNLVKINITFSGTAAGPTSIDNQVVQVVPLSGDFYFAKKTPLKCCLAIDNIVFDMLPQIQAMFYLNYLIMPATTGAYFNIIDCVPMN